MWDFIADNAAPLSALANLLMVIVWVLYFQLLLNGRRRELRAKILINRSAGRSLSGNCIVSNMSADPIYIERIAIAPEPDGQLGSLSLTDLENQPNQPSADARAAWFQGPLSRGDYVNLGSFESLFERLAESVGPERERLDLSKVEAFEISVLAAHGPDDRPVAAVRRFRRSSEPGERAQWHAAPTRQVRSTWERRRLARQIRQEG